MFLIARCYTFQCVIKINGEGEGWTERFKLFQILSWNLSVIIRLNGLLLHWNCNDPKLFRFRKMSCTINSFWWGRGDVKGKEVCDCDHFSRKDQMDSEKNIVEECVQSHLAFRTYVRFMTFAFKFLLTYYQEIRADGIPFVNLIFGKRFDQGLQLVCGCAGLGMHFYCVIWIY